MPLEVGRVCMKIAGREAGKYCVVLKKVNKAFVLVTGPKLLSGVKRRNSNIEHLEALPYTLEIKEEASDDDVISAFDKSGFVKKLGLKLPSAAEMKAEKEKKEAPKEKKVKTEKKEEKPKEKKNRKSK